MTKSELIQSNSIAETARLEAERKYAALRKAAGNALADLQYVDDIAPTLPGWGVRKDRMHELTEALS